MSRVSPPCSAVDLNDPNWIRLLTWVVCDGTMVDSRKYDGEGSMKRRIQFKLSRPEKIAALEVLLVRMGIPYTKRPATMCGVNKLQPWYIRIYGNAGRAIFAALPGKQFPESFRAFTREQFDVLIGAIVQTDGSLRHQHCHWTTTSGSDVGVVTSLCAKHGFVVDVRAMDGASGFKKDCKRQFRVNIALEGARVYSERIAA